MIITFKIDSKQRQIIASGMLVLEWVLYFAIGLCQLALCILNMLRNCCLQFPQYADKIRNVSGQTGFAHYCSVFIQLIIPEEQGEEDDEHVDHGAYNLFEKQLKLYSSDELQTWAEDQDTFISNGDDEASDCSSCPTLDNGYKTMSHNSLYSKSRNLPDQKLPSPTILSPAEDYPTSTILENSSLGESQTNSKNTNSTPYAAALNDTVPFSTIDLRPVNPCLLTEVDSAPRCSLSTSDITPPNLPHKLNRSALKRVPLKPVASIESFEEKASYSLQDNVPKLERPSKQAQLGDRKNQDNLSEYTAIPESDPSCGNASDTNKSPIEKKKSRRSSKRRRNGKKQALKNKLSTEKLTTSDTIEHSVASLKEQVVKRPEAVQHNTAHCSVNTKKNYPQHESDQFRTKVSASHLSSPSSSTSSTSSLEILPQADRVEPSSSINSTLYSTNTSKELPPKLRIQTQALHSYSQSWSPPIARPTPIGSTSPASAKYKHVYPASAIEFSRPFNLFGSAQHQQQQQQPSLCQSSATPYKPNTRITKSALVWAVPDHFANF